MSKEQVKAFIRELHNNKSLKTELESSLDVEEGAIIDSEEDADEIIDQIVGFAANNGHEFSGEEYKSVIIELKKENGELSDNQLEDVAGGKLGDSDSFDMNFITPEMTPVIPDKDNNDEVSPEFL